MSRAARTPARNRAAPATSPAGAFDWSEWQPLPGDWRPAAETLRETLDGGQAFRWTHAPDADDTTLWTGIWSGHVVQIRCGMVPTWRAPDGELAATRPALARYLGADVSWGAISDTLPWRSDTHLRQCLEAYPGLRILRQPFGETLLGFLCSATKQIVQIKQMVALLAKRHGSPIGGTHHRLPTWAELADVPEAELRACLLGFRARYIHQVARFLASRPGWLEETESLPYATAKDRLLELPGVGEKVADCVLLFGAGRLEAFPVDTWILKAMARRYRLEGWKAAQLAQFGRTHFSGAAGLAQQYLFAWERRHGR
ncbi:MAG TPA: DNA glycosylase [Candidatus Didemnitutus sp.]|nr:DNA glycosylase [Candidatus Didemnitutus sp.]